MNTYSPIKTGKKVLTNGIPVAMFIFVAKRITVLLSDLFELELVVDTPSFELVWYTVAGLMQGFYSAIINFWKKYLWPITKKFLEDSLNTNC